MIGPHVFGDGRLGVWFMQNESFTDKLRHRLPKLAQHGITDVFLPESATRADRDLVRQAEQFPAVWTTPANRGPFRYAQESLSAMDRIGAKVLELNIEVRDDRIESYVRECVGEVRLTRKSLRLRVNIAPFKARFLPVDLVVADPNLYVIEQTYFGNMDGRASEDDVRADMAAAGVPEAKGSVMFAAHCSPWPGAPRVPMLPALKVRLVRRGSIYQDDLMADAGYLA